LLLTKRNKKENGGEKVKEGEREEKRRNDALSGEAGGQRC